jgi:1,4-dihydroxy-2-naphthoate octaprenyltransferase
MDERNSEELQGPRTVRVALSVGCTLLILGLLWVAAWKVGWWTPGLGLLSVKAAVMLSMGPAALVAWFARRR